MTIADLNEMVPIDEAAEELHTTQLRLLMLVKGGTLSGEEVDGIWYISRGTIEGVKATGGVAAIAMACKSHCTSSSCSCK